jgi:hypothetical protein
MCFSMVEFPMVLTMVQIVVMTVMVNGGKGPAKGELLGLCRCP